MGVSETTAGGDEDDTEGEDTPEPRLDLPSELIACGDCDAAGVLSVCAAAAVLLGVPPAPVSLPPVVFTVCLNRVVAVACCCCGCVANDTSSSKLRLLTWLSIPPL